MPRTPSDGCIAGVEDAISHFGSSTLYILGGNDNWRYSALFGPHSFRGGTNVVFAAPGGRSGGLVAMAAAAARPPPPPYKIIADAIYGNADAMVMPTL